MLSKGSISSDLILDLENYNIDENTKIGSGIFGDIYKATLQTSEGNPLEFAVQCCRVMHDTKELRQFLDKIEIQSLFKHPTILPLIGYSFPTLNHNYYTVVTPYMPNGNLSDLIRRIKSGPIPDNFETKRAIITFGIAAGMTYIHQKNVIHRDLKPNNILLDINNYPKICDFNFGRYSIESTESAESYSYKSPELIKNANISNKIDIYSYGVILYELWTLRNAFQDDAKATTGQPDKLITARKLPLINKDEVPNSIKDLIEKCWNSDPQLRPSSIQFVKDFLDRKDEFFGDEFIDKVELADYIRDTILGLDFFQLDREMVCFKCKNSAIEICDKCFHSYCHFCIRNHKCNEITNMLKK